MDGHHSLIKCLIRTVETCSSIGTNIGRHSAHLFKPTQTRRLSQRGCPTSCMKAGKMDTFQHLLPPNIDSDPTGRLNKDGFIPVKVDTLVAQPGCFLLSICQHPNFWLRAKTRLYKMTWQPLSINISHIRLLSMVQSIL